MCYCLLLKVRTQPQMVIDDDQAQSHHGSATGALDEQSLFYLMARGLTAEQAKQWLLSGFLQKYFAEYIDCVG